MERLSHWNARLRHRRRPLAPGGKRMEMEWSGWLRINISDAWGRRVVRAFANPNQPMNDDNGAGVRHQWIAVTDQKPKHGQHVLVWDIRDNVFPFPRGHAGDDGEGRVQMGDAIFWSGDTMWAERSREDRMRWDDDPAAFAACNGWDRWDGHGPCSFNKVTHWMPLPPPPTAANPPRAQPDGGAGRG